jgi:hypothetical protein
LWLFRLGAERAGNMGYVKTENEYLMKVNERGGLKLKERE